MSLSDHHHAQEQEDDAVAGGRHGPDTDDIMEYEDWRLVFLSVPCRIFYCSVALLCHIVHGIPLDCYSKLKREYYYILKKKSIQTIKNI